MDVNAFAASLRDLHSHVLLDRFGALVQRDHRVTAGLLCYIAEIDRRELWAEEGYSSMFNFCVEKFYMSEAMAGRRIHAARTMLRFPLVGQMVAKGELHLTAVCLLSGHLTEDNHRNVLARAQHRSKREVQKLVAELEPKPDVPASVRKMPQRGRAKTAARARAATPGSLFDGGAGGGKGTGDNSPSQQAQATTGESEQRRSRVEPLRPQRYKLQMTIGEATHGKLRRLQALLSHRVPEGDPATLFDLALDALLEKAEKERTAATSNPRRRPNAPRGERRTRHVPADVRRAVWKRDGERCAYVSPDGRRCTETRWLELHHRQPFARGGEHTVDGLELRCRPHNQHQANRDYGKSFMDRKRRGAAAQERRTPYARCAIPSHAPAHVGALMASRCEPAAAAFPARGASYRSFSMFTT